jgi:DNA modification methylase/transcriptional regulator with XRE-family HTH domain
MPSRQESQEEATALPLPARLRAFREQLNLDRDALAERIGVKAITLYRWETDTARPSRRNADTLERLGFGKINDEDTNARSRSRLQKGTTSAAATQRAQELRTDAEIELKTQFGPLSVIPAPCVRNGPPDQTEFHMRLLEMQAEGMPDNLASKERYSLLEEVKGFGSPAQHSLERPKPTAVSWNSNYGPHGWHRYVGRFPPHMVRAVLNSFGAGASHLVCDPFVGSGTTAVECRLLGIPFVGIEICPLSAMMTRTKSRFPNDPTVFARHADEFEDFYQTKWSEMLSGIDVDKLTNLDVLGRDGNQIPEFANHEKWFNPEALLGTSIAVEYAMSLSGYEREAVLLALSAKMRSIGNVDVDVVRAEYSKKPREKVDVRALVARHLKKMSKDTQRSVTTHADLIGSPDSIKVIEASVLDVELEPQSVDFVITSPPYGVEAISYLRTHLLSYRSLVSHLGHDPYDTREKTIGSEYLEDIHHEAGNSAGRVSSTMRDYFRASDADEDRKYRLRRLSMLQFCDDMLAVGQKLAVWTKIGGKVAFVIGNKRLGDSIIPMDKIIIELFESCGLKMIDAMRHKLKTNNSNSQVPWQERTIQEEYILIFERA